MIRDFSLGEDKIILGRGNDKTLKGKDRAASFVLGTDQATGFATISGTLSQGGYTRSSGTMAILENITLDQLQAHSDHIIAGYAFDSVSSDPF